MQAPGARPTVSRRPVWELLGAALGVITLACAASGSPDAAAPQLGSSTAAERAEVTMSHVLDLGPYLEADLTGRNGTRRFYFPRSEGCLELVQTESHAFYKMRGPFGLLGRRGGPFCEPVGVASLAMWRDARPRRRESHLPPRGHAAYQPAGTTPERLMLRGRFPLLMELRWPEPMDSIVILPRTPSCEDIYARTSATVEYHAEGEDVFVLEGTSGNCPVHGIAIPVDGTTPDRHDEDLP